MSGSSASSCQQATAKKTVRFEKRVEIYSIVSSADLTEAGSDATWYSNEEYTSIKRRTRRTVSRARKGLLPAEGRHEHEHEHCMRGLEHMRSSLHLEQRRINKDMVIESVLNVQEAQWRKGSSRLAEEAAIAQASATASQWARDLAMCSGAEDEAEVRSIVEAEARRTIFAPTLKQAVSMLTNIETKKATTTGNQDTTKQRVDISNLPSELININPMTRTAAVAKMTEKNGM